MNDYYNFTDLAVSGAVIDGLAYNREMDKITDAFDNFPPAIQFSSGAVNYGEQIGTSTTAYDVNISAIFPGTPYKPGNNVAAKIAVNNTGPITLQVSGGGFKDVRINSSGALVADDLRAQAIYTFVYDGTRWYSLEMTNRYFAVASQKSLDAVASAAAALASQTAAAGSATAAANSRTAAGNSQTAAGNSAAAALASQNAAAGSATAAGTSASDASGSQSAAAGSASTAASRASTADSAASAASLQGLYAQNSETAAAGSETAAANSAADAAASKTAADAILTDPNLATRMRDTIRDLEYPVNAVEFFSSNINPNTYLPGTTWVRLAAGNTIITAAITGADVMGTTGSDTVTMTTTTMPKHSHVVPQKTTSGIAIPGTTSGANLGSPATSLRNLGSPQSDNEDPRLTPVLDPFDYGTITTSAAGAHGHTMPASPNTLGSLGTTVRTFTQRSQTGDASGIMSEDPGHTHAITIGSHTHTLDVPDHYHTVVMPDHDHDLVVPDHTHAVAVPDHTHLLSHNVANTGSATTFSVLNSNIKLVAWYRTA